MIKIKKKEFVKFLQSINETRSSYTRRIDDIEGDQDNKPVDATPMVSAVQLTTALPDLTDEDFKPASNPQLRDAMIAMSREVPDSQIEKFYKGAMDLFEKTIDQMPEEENPFNPKNLSETIKYLFEDKDEEEEPGEEAKEDEEEKPEYSASLKIDPSDEERLDRDIEKQIEKEDEEGGVSDEEYDFYADKLQDIQRDITGVELEDDDAIDNLASFEDVLKMDSENMSDEDFFAALEAGASGPQLSDTEKAIERTQEGFNPVDEIEIALHEIMVAIRKRLVFKKIETFNKVFKDEKYKEMQRNVSTSTEESELEKLKDNKPVKRATESLASFKKRREEHKRKVASVEKAIRSKLSSSTLSSEHLKDEKTAMDAVAMDRAFPSYLQNLAVASDFPQKIDGDSARQNILKGINDIIEPRSGVKRQVDAYLKTIIKNLNTGDSETESTLSKLFSEYGEIKTILDLKKVPYSKITAGLGSRSVGSVMSKEIAKKNYGMSTAVYDDLQRYSALTAAGTKSALVRSAMKLYLAISFALYDKSIADQMSSDVTGRQTKPKSTIVGKASSGKGKRVKMDASQTKSAIAAAEASKKNASPYEITIQSIASSDVQKFISKAIDNYIVSFPVGNTLDQTLELIYDSFTDDIGNIDTSKSISIAKEIASKPVISLDGEETWIYSSCYFQISEVFRLLKIDIKKEVRYSTQGIVLFNPEENEAKPANEKVVWPFLEEADQKIVNSRLEGLSLEAVETICGYVNELLDKSAGYVPIVVGASPEEGGHIDVNIPTNTFVYLAPFILSKMWQKEIANHFQRYKKRVKIGEKEVNIQEEITKLTEYFEKQSKHLKEIAPFAGLTGASGISSLITKHLNHRYQFLKFASQGMKNPGGEAYLESLSSQYGLASMNLIQFFEKYSETIESLLEKESDQMNDDEKEYWNDVLEEVTEILVDLEKIDEAMSSREEGIFADFDTPDSFDDDEDFESDDNEDEEAEFDNREVDNLLLNTVAGSMLRDIVHNTMTKAPRKSESFSADIQLQMREITRRIILKHPNFKVPNVNTSAKSYQTVKFNRAGDFAEQFMGWKKSQRLEIASLPRKLEKFSMQQKMSDAGRFVMHGIDRQTYVDIEEECIRAYDKIFAILFAKKRKIKYITFNEFGPDVEKILKTFQPGSLTLQSDKRLQKIRDSLSDPTAFVEMTDLLESYVLVANLQTEINELLRDHDAVFEITMRAYLSENEMEKSDLKKKDLKAIEKKVKTEKASLQNQAKAIYKQISLIEKNRSNILERK